MKNITAGQIHEEMAFIQNAIPKSRHEAREFSRSYADDFFSELDREEMEELIDSYGVLLGKAKHLQVEMEALNHEAAARHDIHDFLSDTITAIKDEITHYRKWLEAAVGWHNKHRNESKEVVESQSPNVKKAEDEVYRVLNKLQFEIQRKFDVRTNVSVDRTDARSGSSSSTVVIHMFDD